MEALRYTGTTGKIGHLTGHCIERDIDVSKPEGVRYTGQASAKHKGFGAAKLLAQAVKELQNDSAVELHRAADVRDQHEGPSLLFWNPSR